MSFHLYRINELYSNASGTVQFIELAVGDADGESFWAGLSISTTRSGVSHSFRFPGDLPSTATANTKVLIATQGFADLAGVTPDFIVPDGFLFPAGGTLNFGGVDVIGYAALPDDGVHSVTRTGVQVIATPTNFAGATASLPAPAAVITGTPGDDALSGTGAAEAMAGLAGNDSLEGKGGDDSLDGGPGIDVAVYGATRAGATINTTATGHIVTSALDATDSLNQVERLRFADTSVALDLSGNAGIVAKILGAVFGSAEVANPAYAGIGLHYVDGGMSYESLVQLAIDARLGVGASHAAVVELLYNNVAGSPPVPAEAALFVSLLDSQLYTVPGLGVYAAEHGQNLSNIDLVGLSQQGLEYVPYPGG